MGVLPVLDALFGNKGLVTFWVSSGGVRVISSLAGSFVVSFSSNTFSKNKELLT